MLESKFITIKTDSGDSFIALIAIKLKYWEAIEGFKTFGFMPTLVTEAFIKFNLTLSLKLRSRH